MVEIKSMPKQSKITADIIQSNYYEQEVRAIQILTQKVLGESSIQLQQSLPPKEQNNYAQFRSKIRAQKLEEICRQPHPNKYDNIHQLVLNQISLEHKKYANYEDSSDHSSADELEVKFNAQDLVDEVKKQPQSGKMTFVSKIINKPGIDNNFKMIKIKSIQKEMPVIRQVRSINNFVFSEIQINSYHRKFQIQLVFGESNVAIKTKELTFLPRIIALDLPLSFDFKKVTPLAINSLESLLVSCIPYDSNLVDEVIQIYGRREIKQKILRQNLQIDNQTRNVIRQNPLSPHLLKLLVFLMEEEGWKFAKPTNILTNVSYLTVVSVFMEEVLRFEPEASKQERNELALPLIARIIELYLHFVCLTNLQVKGIRLTADKEEESLQKVSQFMQYAFQTHQISLYSNFIRFCINTGSQNLILGYDTINEYTNNYGLGSAERLLVNLLNILYNVKLKRNTKSPTALFIQMFKDCKFEQANIYGQRINQIKDISAELISLLDSSNLKFADFKHFYRAYCNFTENSELSQIVRHPNIHRCMTSYMETIKDKIIRENNMSEKINGIEVLQMYFITLRDEELLRDDSVFRNIFIPLVVDKNQQKQEILSALFALYFQMLKKGDKVFKISLIKQFAGSLKKAINNYPPDKAVKIINYKEDSIQSEQLLKMFDEEIIYPICDKVIPDSLKTLISLFEDHRKWHFEFRFPIHFNEILLEKMARALLKICKNDKFNSYRFLDQIKAEIQIHVEDAASRENLLAIIQIDLLPLDQEHVMEYFTSKHYYLKILAIILKKDQQQAYYLRQTLGILADDIKAKRINFEAIERIKSMKPQDWKTFQVVTKDYDICSLIDHYYKQGNDYINEIRKRQIFVRSIGETYKCPDTEKLLDSLQKALNLFYKQSIKNDRLEDHAPIFNQFKIEILKCYKIKSFYGEEKLQGRSIEEIISFSNKRLDYIIKLVDQIYQQFQSNNLKSTSFYPFNPQEQAVQQFRSILCFGREDKIPESFEDIMDIYKVIAESGRHLSHMEPFLKLLENKFHAKDKVLTDFTDICRNLKDKKDFNISNIHQSYTQTDAKLKKDYDLSLNDKQHCKIFELFGETVLNLQQFSFVEGIAGHLNDLKNIVNEDGGEVTYEQLQNCQITHEYIQLFEKEGRTMKQHVAELTKFIANHKKKQKREFNIAKIVNNVFRRKKQLLEEKAKLLDANHHTTQIMDQVVRKSTFELKFDPKTESLTSNIFCYPEGQRRQIKENELLSTKEKALIIECSMEDNSAQKIKMKSYINICRSFQELKMKEAYLTDEGQKQFEKESVVVQVKQGLSNFPETIEKRETILTHWRKEMQEIYGINFKAAHLQGNQIKNFFQELRNDKKKDISPQFLAINQNSEAQQQIKKRLTIVQQINPQNAIRLMKQYFIAAKSIQNAVLAPDREDDFVHTRIMAKGDTDFLRGIQQLGKERIRTLKFDHIVICTPSTQKSEINSFIDRALGDPDSQYVLLGFQNLGRIQQERIVNKIKTHKENLREQKLKLKLCLVGDSEIELIYRFMKQEISPPPKRSEQELQDCRSCYKQRLTKETENVYIVQSASAGLGKTSFIVKDSSKKGFTDQYYFPLSGRMTDVFIWKRYREMTEYLKEASETKKTCIVLQIYNIENEVVDEVNRFLINLLFFKQHSYKSTIIPLADRAIPVYIELENISLPTFSKDIKDKTLAPQMRTLPFLKEIMRNGVKCEYIPQFSVQRLEIDVKDKRINYIAAHLLKLKNNLIDKEQIKPFNAYQNIEIANVAAKQLFREYFFNKFQIDNQPSAYLWKYFTSLLFEALSNFSSSLFLGFTVLNQIDSSLKRFSLAIHGQFKLRATFRSEFMKVIIDNCVQFIKRSVKPGKEGEDNLLKQTLQNLPFLIIPNKDGDSFSFIYNKSDKVPITIKRMIVLQQTQLFNKINTKSVDQLFQEENIAKFEKTDTKKWIDRASMILQNISGNRTYQINCEEGYIVNIDNFFKMCLITQRMRLNIPIVIMGEAGIGKTALLRHVVQHLYKDEFAVYNINAGLPIETQEKQGEPGNQSLMAIVADIKTCYDRILAENTSKKQSRKLWVFFDEFNTLRELGFFKQIILDGRFLGKAQQHTSNVVMMAACNPHKKFKSNNQGEHYVKEQTQRLAFDVVPAPHSLVETMWNYGALSEYEYQRYIGKMLNAVKYQNAQLAKLVLLIHKQIGIWLFESAVSLRDIERLRQLYKWFVKCLPTRLTIPQDQLHTTLGQYNRIEERALIMSLYFTYLLRFEDHKRLVLEKLIEKQLKLKQKFVRIAKETQEKDLCNRMDLKGDDPIAVNDSLKENLYSCFVCIWTRLPLLIIGAPGSSKSLSLRLLVSNFQKLYLQYFRKEENSKMRIRQFSIQGSQNSKTEDIKKTFQSAHLALKKNRQDNVEQRQILTVVFDEIGLAQKSKDNPLKVLHPYLEVNRQAQSEAGQSLARMLSFIGISNSQLDVSKMSRLLVLRRPPATQADLRLTSLSIAQGYTHGEQPTIIFFVKKLTQSYVKFLTNWHLKINAFPLFYGLRDFYGLIKTFMIKLSAQQVNTQEVDAVINSACQSIFQNFNGWGGSFEQFRDIFLGFIDQNRIETQITMRSIIDTTLQVLSCESMRYPMIIAQDQESLSFMKWAIENKYPSTSVYLEGSPFKETSDYSLKLLGEICQYMAGKYVLILSNLSEGVKTGLYDFFNKSFNTYNGGNKYLRIRTQSIDEKKRMFFYNSQFNCVYLIQSKDLDQLEPPFLSRFQKYRFSLKQYNRQTCENLLKKVKQFGNKVQTICATNKMDHYKFNTMFANVSEQALQSLVVLCNELAGPQNAYRQVIRKLITNSGQQFCLIFKYFMQKNGDLPELADLIQATINEKNEQTGDRSFIVRFTNEQNYLKKYERRPQYSCLQFSDCKTEQDLETPINKFYTSKTKKTLFISLRIIENARHLHYLVGKIEKIRKREMIQNQNMGQKHVRLVYRIERGRVDVKTKIEESSVPISHFSKFTQQFDDGKMGQVVNDRTEFFKSVVPMENLLKYVNNVFDISFQNTENPQRNKAYLNSIFGELYYRREGTFILHCEEALCCLQGVNFTLSEDNIKQILNDKQNLKKNKSFKDAMTKYFADKKYLGALAVFIKYLFDRECFLSYTTEYLEEYLEKEVYQSKYFEGRIKDTKEKTQYKQFIKDMLKIKLTQFLKQTYFTAKCSKQLPSATKKYVIKLNRPRIIPFSKAECELILNNTQKKGISWYIKQIYAEGSNSETAYNIYFDYFKEKTTFASGQNNYYAKYINEDVQLKQLLFLDLLTDFAELKGLPVKFVPGYMQILHPLFDVNANKNINFQKMASILIGFEDIWIQIFRICNTFYEQSLNLPLERVNVGEINKKTVQIYCTAILKRIQAILLSPNILKQFKNSELYSKIVINVLFHMQKLEQFMEINIDQKLVSIRTTIVFLQIYDPDRKSTYIEGLMKVRSVIHLNQSHHQQTQFYLEDLKKDATKEQQIMMTEFQANKIFWEWFRQEPDNSDLLRLFIKNCEDEVFAHNSVAVINRFLQSSYPRYSNILDCFEKFNSKDNRRISKHMIAIGEEVTKSQFKSNLSILITNIFMQKLIKQPQNGNIVKDKTRDFEQILNRITTGNVTGTGILFAFAFIKIILNEYISLLLEKYTSSEMVKIDQLLAKDNVYCNNFKFYCLKLLRTRLPIKQIKDQFIKIKKVSWITYLNDLFEEQQARSIFVPRDANEASGKMKALIEAIMQSDGKLQNFDQLFEQAKASPYNRYTLFNFFLRYYFSLSYNYAAYKPKIIQKLVKQKTKYIQHVGAIQYDLIMRYANAKFDDRIQIANQGQFKEEIFLYFNSFNWLLATRTSKSPFHSIFLNEGQFHPNFKTATDNLFFPCGIQNPFIRQANIVRLLSRNNNIGVYLCSGYCDNIYFHQNCGWPSQTSKCDVCGGQIGNKAGKSHTVTRQQQGAKRVMSPMMIDKGGPFYVYNMTGLTNYWQMQRHYIDAEVNRMKMKSTISMKNVPIKLTGYQMQNVGKISNLSYSLFRQNLNSVFYCLLSLGIIQEEDSKHMFQSKGVVAAKAYLFQEHQKDLQNIKSGLNIGEKLYGWIFGMHRYLYSLLTDFKQQFGREVNKIKADSLLLANKLLAEVNQKKVHNNYHDLYTAMANDLKNGLLTRQILTITDMTAVNQWTRDLLEQRIQDFVAGFTGVQKFNLSQQNTVLQGKMQFPHDVVLTEDKLIDQKFTFSRMLKIPDKQIKYNEIVVAYELQIRQNYPFLDYVLKNCENINDMRDFYRVLSFSNELAAQIENTYERKQADRSLKDFIRNLQEKRRQGLHQVLKKPERAVEAWNRLAVKLGILQNNCTVVGRMDSSYSLDTETKAFLLDNSTKQNAFGLFVSSLFHNFAKLHNDLITNLNARKNQIAQYRCLNLYNEFKKVHPQKLAESDVYIITQKQLQQKLFQFSISSISYGRNYIFNNFASYEYFFLMKLQGKCEINSNIQSFKSVCYNGEAFAQTSNSSSTLNQIRDYFYQELTQQQTLAVKTRIRTYTDEKEMQNFVIDLRGDLQKIMIAIRNLNGMIEGSKQIGSFVERNKIQTVTTEITVDFNEIQITKIVHLYELLEQQLKPILLRNLPKRYQQKMDFATEKDIKRLVDSLPVEADDVNVTLCEFGDALFRYIARNLQGGVVQEDVILIEFLPSRLDLWPKDFEDYKPAMLTMDDTMKTLTLAYTGHLYSIVDNTIRAKLGDRAN